MTLDELDAIRDHVGSEPDDAELGVMFGRLGSVEAVALAVIRKRRAELLLRPADLDVDGDVHERWEANIKALGEQEASLAASVVPADDEGRVVRVATLRRSGRTR